MRSNKIKNFIHFNFFSLLLVKTHYFTSEAKYLSVYLDLLQLHFTGEELRLKETNVIKWARRKKKTDKSGFASPSSTYYL